MSNSHPCKVIRYVLIVYKHEIEKWFNIPRKTLVTKEKFANYVVSLKWKIQGLVILKSSCCGFDNLIDNINKTPVFRFVSYQIIQLKSSENIKFWLKFEFFWYIQDLKKYKIFNSIIVHWKFINLLLNQRHSNTSKILIVITKWPPGVRHFSWQ